MAIIRKKEIANMAKEELQRRLAELRIELVRTKAQKASKTAGTKTREIKRTIARILTKLNIGETKK